MSKRSQSIIVSEIIGFIDRIGSYTDEMTYPEFASQSMVVDACLHNIQVIGEAIKQLREETRQKSESIPWNLISGIQGRLVGENLHADPEAVWEVVHHALPELKEKLERLCRRLAARDL